MSVLNSSKWNGFLYRRLARWITCELHLLGRHSLALNSKYQLNSLQDVFCHPFYWQLFSWLPYIPSLIVDLGAHCGHFSMLADVCLRTRFGDVETEYVLVEANPRLIPVIDANLSRSGLCRRRSVHQGLIGARSGSDKLWISSKNYLSASISPVPAGKSITVNYLDLGKLLGVRPIDLLKIDIEGAEYDFVANYPELLSRVQYLMIEVHSAQETHREQLFKALHAAGLYETDEPLIHSGYQLARFQRRMPGSPANP
jgi:FkbM family methyltransferase